MVCGIVGNLFSEAGHVLHSLQLCRWISPKLREEKMTCFYDMYILVHPEEYSSISTTLPQPWFLSPVSLGEYPKVWTTKFSIASLVWQAWYSWHVNALMWHVSRVVCHGPNAIHSFNVHPVNIYYVLELHNKRTHSYRIDASSTFSCFWAEKNCCVGQFLPGLEPCKSSATLRLWKDVFLTNWH